MQVAVHEHASLAGSHRAAARRSGPERASSSAARARTVSGPRSAERGQPLLGPCGLARGVAPADRVDRELTDLVEPGGIVQRAEEPAQLRGDGHLGARPAGRTRPGRRPAAAAPPRRATARRGTVGRRTSAAAPASGSSPSEPSTASSRREPSSAISRCTKRKSQRSPTASTALSQPDVESADRQAGQLGELAGDLRRGELRGDPALRRPLRGTHPRRLREQPVPVAPARCRPPVARAPGVRPVAPRVRPCRRARSPWRPRGRGVPTAAR